MSIDFTAASAIERLSELTFSTHVPDGWQQGRGAFGGLVLGALLRAMETVEPDRARATRTLSGDLCGPVLPGAAEIVVRVLRRGANQSNLAAELRQGGATLATASAVLSTPRPQPEVPRADAFPAAPDADDLDGSDWRTAPLLPVSPPTGPVFTANYEYRSRGPAPFLDNGRRARATGWVRERVPLPRVDAPALIGRLDAWWPTLFHLEPRPRPIATVSFTAELLIDPATLAPDEPLRYRAQMAALHDGFFVELRELWHGRKIVALNQQTFAIIK